LIICLYEYAHNVLAISCLTDAILKYCVAHLNTVKNMIFKSEAIGTSGWV